MKNIFGHEHNVELYDTNGRVRYKYTKTNSSITETHYDEFGDIDNTNFKEIKTN